MRIDAPARPIAPPEVAAEPAGAAGAAAPAQPRSEASLPPGATLAWMARQGPPAHLEGAAERARLAQAAAGQTLADRVRGTQPRPIDAMLARMANDVYSIPQADGQGRLRTQTQSEAELHATGWQRVPPGEAVRTADGRTLRVGAEWLSQPAIGFQAALYHHRETGGIVVAFAGTNPNSVADWGANLSQGLGLRSRQHDMAVNLARMMNLKVGAQNVAYTGHSLGGGLAALATVASGSQGVSFNGAGLSNETLRPYGNPNTLRASYAGNGALRSYGVDGDPLTALSHTGLPPPLGRELTLPLVGAVDPLARHGGGGDSHAYVDGLGAAGVGQRAADPPVQRTLAHAGQALLNSLGGVIHHGLGLAEDAQRIGQETVRDVQAAACQPSADTPARIGAELADGALETAGAAADHALGTVAREVTVATDALGALLRDGRADSWAQGLERLGVGVRRGLEGLGHGLRWALDNAVQPAGRGASGPAACAVGP